MILHCWVVLRDVSIQKLSHSSAVGCLAYFWLWGITSCAAMNTAICQSLWMGLSLSNQVRCAYNTQLILGSFYFLECKYSPSRFKFASLYSFITWEVVELLVDPMEMYENPQYVASYLRQHKVIPACHVQERLSALPQWDGSSQTEGFCFCFLF